MPEKVKYLEKPKYVKEKWAYLKMGLDMRLFIKLYKNDLEINFCLNFKNLSNFV